MDRIESYLAHRLKRFCWSYDWFVLGEEQHDYFRLILCTSWFRCRLTRQWGLGVRVVRHGPQGQVKLVVHVGGIVLGFVLDTFRHVPDYWIPSPAEIQEVMWQFAEINLAIQALEFQVTQMSELLPTLDATIKRTVVSPG